MCAHVSLRAENVSTPSLLRFRYLSQMACLPRITTALLLLLFSTTVCAQKVGLVLSGGGSSGLAHVGVIKALEEHNVPIDYITGTSMGALIGGMYSAGYSIAEIEALIVSRKFQDIATGHIDPQFNYPFLQREADASWAGISFTRDSIWRTFLPASVTEPAPLDFELMTLLSAAVAEAGYNFDSLYIPFRCLASDIEDKETVVFRSGHLSQAIRASMSYPFYLKPIKVDGKLLFDGGLYNNFPADIMCNDFQPDVTIGSNVSYNFDPPEPDDPLSQIKNMLVSKTAYEVPCNRGIVLEPEVTVSTFDFSRAPEIIAAGYNATIANMPSILAMIEARETFDERALRRTNFKNDWKELNFGTVKMEALNKRQSAYVRNTLQRKRNKKLSLADTKRGYFKVFSDDHIESIYPTASWNEENGNYDLLLNVKRSKDLKLVFGGNFSSRPINTAYIGLRYQHLGRLAFTVDGNSYFGRLYGSTQLSARMDVPWIIPFYVRGQFALNRWDYFRSQATFFEDVKPSFLVQNENYAGGAVGVPVGRKGKIEGGANSVVSKDTYYQTDNFLSTDTADQTRFDAFTAYVGYDRNSLNRKQYADAGSQLTFSARYIQGTEITDPGSTSINRNSSFNVHEWFQLKGRYQNYYKRKGKLHLGFLGEGVWSDQGNFNNYTASTLRAPAFQPTPESKTYFLDGFRAYKYAAVGHQLVYRIFNNFDLRLEGYLFQPYEELQAGPENELVFGPLYDRRFTIAMAGAVYHTPVGPLSFTTNYYFGADDVGQLGDVPVTLLFHFGYIIFNNRAFQ